MALKITTVAALSVLVAAAGLPLAVGQNQPSSEQTEALRQAAIERHNMMMQQQMVQNEIRVYDLGDVLGDEPARTIRAFEALLGGVLIAGVGGDRYAVNARPDEHERFEALLAQLQQGADDEEADADDTDRTYTVRILAGIAPDADAPSVGDRFPRSGIEVLFAPQITVNSGDTASVSALETETYIAGYQPVVSNNAVAYDAGTDEMQTGVEMEITVEDDGDDAVEINLEGRIATGEVREQTLKLGDSSLPIGLPFVRDRNIEARITLPATDGPTIVASLPGFEPGTRLIIAVHVADFGRRRGQ